MIVFEVGVDDTSEEVQPEDDLVGDLENTDEVVLWLYN